MDIIKNKAFDKAMALFDYLYLNKRLSDSELEIVEEIEKEYYYDDDTECYSEE